MPSVECQCCTRAPSALHFGQEEVVRVGEHEALELHARAGRSCARRAVEQQAAQAREVRLLRHADDLQLHAPTLEAIEIIFTHSKTSMLPLY